MGADARNAPSFKRLRVSPEFETRFVEKVRNQFREQVRAFLDGSDGFIPVDFPTLILLVFLLGVIFENGRLKAQRAQLNKEKTEFLGIAAHDLKNAPTANIGNAELQLDARLDGVHRG